MAIQKIIIGIGIIGLLLTGNSDAWTLYFSMEKGGIWNNNHCYNRTNSYRITRYSARHYILSDNDVISQRTVRRHTRTNVPNYLYNSAEFAPIIINQPTCNSNIIVRERSCRERIYSCQPYVPYVNSSECDSYRYKYNNCDVNYSEYVTEYRYPHYFEHRTKCGNYSYRYRYHRNKSCRGHYNWNYVWKRYPSLNGK